MELLLPAKRAWEALPPRPFWAGGPCGSQLLHGAPAQNGNKSSLCVSSAPLR